MNRDQIFGLLILLIVFGSIFIPGVNILKGLCLAATVAIVATLMRVH